MSFDRLTAAAFPLAVAFLVVLSLVVANFLVTVLFADRLAGRIRQSSGGAAFDDPTFTALTTLMAGWVIFSFVLGTSLGLAHVLKPGRWPKARSKPSAEPRFSLVTFSLDVLIQLWIACTIAIGVVPVLALVFGLNVDDLGLPIFDTYSVWVWGLLIVVSAVLRKMMIQFPGDVAAYLSTHTLDRFQEIRSKIKDWVGGTAKAIYASNEYEGVVWVGHSLGSVVVYDALNALIVDDELAQRNPHVVERTKLLLTFGSPLDKIAFIFATQWANTTETREALAASFQPLILDYERFRRIRWVNIYSPADIISSKLRFYDDPSQSGDRHVQDLADDAATTPLLAHIEYWSNRLLFEQIYEGVVAAAASAHAGSATLAEASTRGNPAKTA